MAFKFRFNIEEQPDAESFIFYDVTGDYSAENTEGWGSPNIEKADVTDAKITVKKWGTNETEFFTLPVDATLWAAGVEFFRGTPKIFEDGAYEFTITINTTTHTSIKSFGFFAIIKSFVMVECLSYNPALPRRTKDMILEKGRLLDNMYYATETDQIQHFLDNLEILKRLE